ncbi:MAG: hypothetical protein ABJA10_09995 [Aestuariivirga sp.]
MKLSTRSLMIKSLLAIGVTVTLAGCVSDGYGMHQGMGGGYYGNGMHGQGMQRHWNRQMHGNRCRVAFGNCRHFHDGYFYESSWWMLPL